MKRSSAFRKAVNMSDTLPNQLNMYALAASAAGVSFLASAQSSEAKIVYTPVHRRITVGRDTLLDLNNDAKNDFKFHVLQSTFPGGTFLALYVSPEHETDRIWGFGDRYASALPKEVRLGGPKHSYFYTSANFMAGLSATSNGARKYSGPWANGGQGVKNRYLGLKFVKKGHMHFGWARLNVRISYSQKVIIDAVLTGYAYETIPNKPIITGKIKGPDDSSIKGPSASVAIPISQPATLGMLALGAPGLAIWRREESMSPAQ